MLNLNYIYISYNIIHIIYICYKIYLKIHYIKSKTLAKYPWLTNLGNSPFAGLN